MKRLTFQLAVIVALGMALFAGPSRAGTIVLSNNFDGGATVGPAFQQVANGLGAGGSANPTTGVITTSTNSDVSAYGLNTISSLDLSEYTAFTITWVVSAATLTGTDAEIRSNGWLFGVTNSTLTDGNGLFNNVSESAGLLMIATTTDGWEFYVRDNSTRIVSALNGDQPDFATFEDGFTLSLTLKDDNTWSASSTGLSNNINLTNQALLGDQTYATLAGNAVAYTSMQGWNTSYNVDSVTIIAVPEPSTLVMFGIVGLAGLLSLRRRRAS